LEGILSKLHILTFNLGLTPDVKVVTVAIKLAGLGADGAGYGHGEI
jgi:hypothetical protein